MNKVEFLKADVSSVKAADEYSNDTVIVDIKFRNLLHTYTGKLILDWTDALPIVSSIVVNENTIDVDTIYFGDVSFEIPNTNIEYGTLIGTESGVLSIEFDAKVVGNLETVTIELDHKTTNELIDKVCTLVQTYINKRIDNIRKIISK